tara:strand:+ start:663 stop:833 length:171 start_codon:yes stop_codon:yes gene_type:complete
LADTSLDKKTQNHQTAGMMNKSWRSSEAKKFRAISGKLRNNAKDVKFQQICLSKPY